MLLLILNLMIQLVSVRAESSGALLTRSLELLQRNERVKALSLLEKAFETSQSSNEKIEIAILILETSVDSNPKREAFLRFLSKQAATEQNISQWLIELADRSLAKGELSEAETLYRRALNDTSNPVIVRYKIAFVTWNQKKPLEAWRMIVELIPSASPSLKTQICKDLGRLWWDIGPLPQDDFSKLKNLESAEYDDVLTYLFRSAPQASNLSRRDNELFVQLKTDPTAATKLYAFLAEDDRFMKVPCYPFENLISSENPFSRKLLFACLKNKSRPNAERMFNFFDHLADESDEKWRWAKAELLVELKKTIEAIDHLFSDSALASRSRDFLTYFESLLLRLSENDFRQVFEKQGKAPFESFLSASKSKSILERLQALDPDVWIAFEERHFDTSRTKDFLLKKGAYLARKGSPPVEEIQAIFEKLLHPASDAQAKKLELAYRALQTRALTRLPDTFSRRFKKEFDAWLRDLDRFEIATQKAEGEWALISRQVFQLELRKNVDAIIHQLKTVKLDPELVELSDSFSKKIDELVTELEQRYAMPQKAAK